MQLAKIISDLKTTHPGAFPEWAKEGYLKFRQRFSSKRALPDFLVIGAQKSGSTSLFNYIAMHPQVFPSIQKEIFYFNKYFDNGELWYRRYFPFQKNLSRNGMVTGEATTTYLASDLAPERVKELLPNAKLIAVLRDPVERAVSQYYHCIRTGREVRGLEEVFNESLFAGWKNQRDLPSLDRSYLENGLYAEQLSRWLNYYSEDQLLVIQAEQLFYDPIVSTMQVYDFLRLSEHKLEALPVFNKGSPREIVGDEIYQRLKEFYSVENAQLYKLPMIKFFWDYSDLSGSFT